MIITIDGPVASGKSTVAIALAKELNIYYLHTGLLYRAVAYLLIKKFSKDKQQSLTLQSLVSQNISLEEFSSWVDKITLEQIEFIKKIVYDYGEKGAYIFFEEEDITQYLHDKSLDQPASIVSSNAIVRDALLDTQRNVATRYDVVADGRDCGSVIFPDADYKFFLTASLQVRAQRAMLDANRGVMGKDMEKVKVGLEQRDARDRKRKVAPLTVPKNSILIDNSNLTFNETVKKFLSFIKRK